MDKRKTVLICDDEEGVREALKLILEDDYDLSFAISGPEAIEKIRQGLPDLVILDIKMPKMNGLEALKHIKKLSPNTKVIIASGYKSVETAQESIKNGASDYLVKPFDSKLVLEAVKTVVGAA
ncbi:MAG: response regulator [Candidatus Omnitrophica bacterium]|nr:response regulator [Candidatus Omnitrophota bacterium]